MVGKIMSKPEKRKTPGKKMATTTYKKGGKVKKMHGGAMHAMPNGTMMPGAKHGMKKGGSAKKKSKFPDHSGDGKITKKDILMAKGIIPKKKGMMHGGKVHKKKK